MNNTELQFSVHKYGNIEPNPTGCENVGSIFNPLDDPDTDEVESRGTIPNYTTVNIVAADVETFTEKKFLQNLSGKNSIVGRSIVVTDISGPTILACCVIGLDSNPDLATDDDHDDHSYTPHYHGYGLSGYGGGYGNHDDGFDY